MGTVNKEVAGGTDWVSVFANMNSLPTHYERWHRTLCSMLDERGAASDLARFLCDGRAEAEPGHRSWVSPIKAGRRKPDGIIMAAINAWIDRRKRSSDKGQRWVA